MFTGRFMVPAVCAATHGRRTAGTAAAALTFGRRPTSLASVSASQLGRRDELRRDVDRHVAEPIDHMLHFRTNLDHAVEQLFYACVIAVRLQRHGVVREAADRLLGLCEVEREQSLLVDA